MPAALPRTIVLIGFVALVSCQSVDDQTATSAASEASATQYPSLHTVPPRPRLTYSVRQQRAIVEGLIGDRENARYTKQVVRYRTGQSSLPPPPPVVAATEPADLIPSAETAATSSGAAQPAPAPFGDDGGRALGGDFDEDTLSSFVDQLARDTEEDRKSVV